MEQRKTTCVRDCPDACAIVADVHDGRIVRLGGDPDHPITRGFLCYRTNAFLAKGPPRLATPLVRDGDRLVPASWDHALDLAARALLRIKAESGPAAILHYRSGGSLGLSKHVVDYVFERFGPVTTKRGDICSGAGEAAQLADFGRCDSHDLADLVNARHVILWGKNPVISGPHVVPVLREAIARGAKVALVDPAWHEAARFSEVHVQPRPGGDVALAMAVAHALAEIPGGVDARAAEYCDHWDRFWQLVRSRSLAAWCREADVGEATAVDLARRLADRPCAIQVGWGMARRANGGAIVRALDALGAVSGNLGIPGGGVSYYYARRAAFDTSFATGAAARTLCEPTLARDLAAAKDPPIRAAWITAGNPVAMLPDSRAMVRALSQLELLVCVDSFLTDTARLAHVVLPHPTFLEADDLVGAYGHHYLGRARPLVAPPDGCRSDFDIAAEMAPRLGLGDLLGDGLEAWLARIAAPRLAPAGIGLADLESRYVKSPVAETVLFASRVFPTATGKVQLMDAEGPSAPKATRERPLLLMALSTRHSQSSVWSGAADGLLPCTVHPDSAPGIADGEPAWLESALGRIEVTCRHDPRQRRDVALVPKGGHLADGRCANALVAGAITDLGEGGALYDQPVQLVRREEVAPAV